MRNRYNLSNLIHTAGHIGRLQTLQVIPVVAGESIHFSIEGIFRLAATRKEIVSECQLDFCGFFVPYRHIYGQDWIDFINEGVDSPAVFPAGISIPAEVRQAPFLTVNTTPATLPRHTVEGYNRIYQRYFAVPTTNNTGGDNQSGFEDVDYFPIDTDDPHKNYRLYGKLAARLPHILNGGTQVAGAGASGRLNDLSDEDATFNVLGTPPNFDIRDLALVKSRYKSEIDNTWFAQFYTDIMERKWGRGVNTDADQRPEFLFRETRFVSGFDVNGTGDANLGNYVGKTLAPISLNMRRKAFIEHGLVWIMMVARYPLVHTDEVHPILLEQPTYDYFAAEQDRYKALAPIQWDPARYLSIPTTYSPTNAVLEPYGQHYRFQPNNVHPNFKTIPGYPFTSFNPNNYSPWYYYQDNEYFNTFHSSPIGQWQIHANMNCTKFSIIPGPISSIMAGAN